jgi:glycosyltransferase involved in cell wall biosynthesis
VRIGIDYTSAMNQSAGIGRYTREIVRALAEIDRENEYFLFYAQGRQGQGASRSGAPGKGQPRPLLFPDNPNFLERPIPVSDRTLAIIWHRLAIPLAIDLFTGPVDVFFFPDFTRAPLRRGRSVVVVHDLGFLMVPECADAGLRSFLERVVPASVSRADFVIVDSEHTRNDVVTLLDVPEDKVEVVYCAVEPSFRRVTDEARLEAIRRRYRLYFRFILHVGMIEPRKNLQRLVQAYAQFRDTTGLPHKLVLAGKLGWLYQEIFREIEELRLGDEVVFPGFVPDADLPALYSLADAFAFPSLYEGFGLPPLEAMACGTPVVCSNSSSLPEVVGDAALTVEPTDVEGLSHALGRVLEDEGLRAEMVSKGFAQASLFSWEAAARKLLGCFERVVERREARH